MSRGQGKRTAQLLAAAYEILKQMQPASVRAVAYQLFIKGLIRDMGKSSTNSVSRLLTIARENGEIPWSWLVDESREAESVPTWSSPTAIITAAVRQYRRDYWAEQDWRIEVWSEKGTVRGTIWPVLQEYGVTFRVMHGYASATTVNDISILSTSIAKPFVALYVGDWDPSGKHMSDVDLPNRLKRYGGNLDVRRIALLRGDLAELPRFALETKSRDPRHRWFHRNIGTACYELDAMPPPLLRSRVEYEIRSFIDLDRWDHARMVEKAETDSMQSFVKSWQASISGDGGRT